MYSLLVMLVIVLLVVSVSVWMAFHYQQKIEQALQVSNAALKAQEQRFQELVMTMADWVWEASVEGGQLKFNYCSDRVTHSLGYVTEEVIGKTLFDFMQPEEAQRLRNIILPLIADYHPLVEIETWYTHKDGRSICFLVNAVPVRAYTREFVTYLGTNKDITERKQAETLLKSYNEILNAEIAEQTLELYTKNLLLEKEVKERERIDNKQRDQVIFLQTLIDGLSNPLFYKDLEGRYLGCNRAFEEFTGLSKAEVIGKTVFEVYPKELADEFHQMDHLLMQQGHTQIYEGPMRYADGSMREVIFNKTLFTNAKGQVIGLVGVLIDISARKQAEAALREANDRFVTVLDSLDALVYVADMETYDILFANHEACRLVNAEVIGKTCWKTLQTGQTQPCDFCTNSKLVDAQGQATGVYRWEFYNELLNRWFFVQDRAIHWTDGRLVRLEIATDITEYKRSQVERERLLAELEQSTQLLRAIIDATEDWIFVKNTFYRYILVNKGFATALHATPEAIINKNDLEIGFPSEQVMGDPVKGIRGFRVDDRTVLESGETVHNPNDVARFWDGSVHVFDTLKMPLRNIEGRIIGLVGIARDVTGRKHMEDALRHSEERARLLFRYAPMGIALINASGQFVQVNSAFRHLFGYNEPEFEQLSLQDVTLPSDWANTLQTLEALYAGRVSFIQWERQCLRKGQQLIWCILSIAPIWSDENHAILSVSDITARKEAEEALKRSEERFELAMRGANDGLWDWNLRTGDCYFSTRFKEILGFTETDSFRRPEEWMQRIHPEDAEQVLKANWDYLRRLTPESRIIYRLQHKEGHYVWVLDRAIGIWDDNNKPLRMVGMITDITARKEAEAQLQTAYFELNQFKITLDRMLDAVCMFDAQTLHFIYASQGAVDLFGYSREELEHMTPVDIKIKFTLETFREFILKPLMDGSQRWASFEAIHRRKTGELLIGEVFLQYVYEPGHVSRFVSIMRDITERKSYETELKEAKAAAETANRAKSTFLANMSHELRTPLNGILGYAQILNRDRSLSPKQREGIEIIHRSGEYLLTLINDVLDLSKIEAGRIELQTTTFNFNEFLQGVSELFLMRAQQKGIQFTCERLSPLPLGIQADEKRLRQVLINLIGNAVKFTEKGNVTLKVSYEQGVMRFEIEDTGIGIAPDEVEKIFLPFQQVGDQKYRAEGTGLGLSITKKLVEMMGGELQLDSVLGQGSRFWVLLHLPQADDDFVTVKHTVEPLITGYHLSPSVESPRQLLIFVVDDKKENRSLVSDLLTPLGFDIRHAENGQVALEKLQSFSPDLFFIDLLMPVMDGFELCRHVRNMPEYKNTPIIAASASVFDEQQQHSLKVGCNAFIPKPIRAEVLLELLRVNLNLTWIYEEKTEIQEEHPAEETPIDLAALTVEQATTLSKLAHMGDIGGIIDYVEQLKQTDTALIPLANRIIDMARRFQEEEICALVDHYIGNEE